jgi:hypothetical protein
MTQITVEEKLKRAAGVICKQGMVQFPLSDTAIAIVASVVGDDEEEFDLIYAFREKPSQTMDQLIQSSGFAMEKIEQLATNLARKGLIFNQPNSAGIMVYRLLPLMLVGVMEYKFMVELTGSQEEARRRGTSPSCSKSCWKNSAIRFRTIMMRFRPCLIGPQP